MNYRILIVLMIASTFFPVELTAQEARYRWDFGGGVGISGYNGDANSGFPFRHPGFAASVIGRYNIDTRWSLKAQLGGGSLKGNTADMDNVLPGGASYSFTSTVWDMSVSGEFNFFPYGIGETYKHLRRCTPYLSVGLGAVMSRCGGKSFTAVSVPLGAGVKYRVSERLNLGGELSFSKVFGDHVDGEQLSDLYGIKSSFLKNTDWYSRLTVSVTYEFGERCRVCNRKD